jgi:hypothetical protein
MSTRKSTKKPLTALRIKNMNVGETLADIGYCQTKSNSSQKIAP